MDEFARGHRAASTTAATSTTATSTDTHRAVRDDDDECVVAFAERADDGRYGLGATLASDDLPGGGWRGHRSTPTQGSQKRWWSSSSSSSSSNEDDDSTDGGGAAGLQALMLALEALSVLGGSCRRARLLSNRLPAARSRRARQRSRMRWQGLESERERTRSAHVLASS